MGVRTITLGTMRRYAMFVYRRRGWVGTRLARLWPWLARLRDRIYDRIWYATRHALWRVARWVHQAAPGLGARLGAIRRRLMPHLYEPDELSTENAPAAADPPSGNADTAVDTAPVADPPTSASSADSEVMRLLKGLRLSEIPLERRGVVHYIGSLQAGGAERQVVYTLSGLAARRISTALVVSEGLKGNLGHYLPLVRSSGVPYRWAGERLDPRFEALLASHPKLWESFRSIPRFLRARVADAAGEFLVMRPQIVHCWLDHTNLWGGIAARLAGVPHIVLSGRNVAPIHFPYLLCPWFRDAYLWLLEQPGVRMVNNSNPGARDYAGWLGIDAARVRVILNGIDCASIQAPPPAECLSTRRALLGQSGQRLVLGVARLSDEKQPMVFLEVARRVCAERPGTIFAMVGEGALKGEIRRAIRGGGLQSQVLMLGRRNDIPTLMRAADLLLLTSRAEGTPNVLLEAQYLGCPPVSTKAGGAVDAVIDGQTGFLVDVGDLETLAMRVIELLDNEPLRQSMIARGPGFVQDRFGLDRMIDETISLYADMDPSGAWRRSADW